MKSSFVVPTRNVVLTDREAEMVERLIRSGRFRTASDVLREGLRLLADSEATHEPMLAAVPDAPEKPQSATAADEPSKNINTAQALQPRPASAPG